MNTIPIIDPHLHFWDLDKNYHPWLCDPSSIPFRYGDYTVLKRNYLPDSYEKDASGFNVVGTVYVEAEWDPKDPIGETRWVTALANHQGLPSAIVAQAWLEHEDAAEVLRTQATFARVRGIRQKPNAASSPVEACRGAAGSMDDPRFRDGFACLASLGLSYDLQTPWWHLDAALELAQDFPDTQIILNHTGLPADRSAEGLAGWRKAMGALSDAPNVALKISGLGQPGKAWTIDANGPVIRDALSIFGAERCMFASNFPVDSLCAAFQTIFSSYLTLTANLDADLRQGLFHENARRIYRLKP